MRKSLHVWHLVVTALLLVYDIEALLGERLALLAVDIERCGGGCGLDGQLHLALGGEGVVERVEIIFALVAQTTCHGVCEEECRLWAVEEHGALGLGLTIHSEGDAMTEAHLVHRQAQVVSSLHLIERHGCLGASHLVHTWCLAQQTLLLLKLVEGQRGERRCPGLVGDDLQHGEYAVVHIGHGYAVAVDVVPQGKHAAHDAGVVLLKRHVAEHARCPGVIEVVERQIVVIIVGHRHDVGLPVGHADHLPSLTFHLYGVCHVVRPQTHGHALLAHGRRAVGMRERTPHHRTLAVALDEGEVTVGVGAELLL